MDGLLANLFDMVSQRTHRKSYQASSKEDKLAIKDLWENKEEFVRRVGGVERLFSELDPYPTNDILLRKVVSRFGGFYLCSHPAKIDREACIRGKLSWIERHISGVYREAYLGVHFPSQKEEFAVGDGGQPNLLIDDFRPYIEAWERRGGVAIRVRSDRFSSLDEFEEFIDAEFTKLDDGGARVGSGL
jgi:hypothetical protein